MAPASSLHFGSLGVHGRIQGIEPDVAEPARHTDEIGRLDPFRVRAVLLGIPRRGIELGVAEPPQSDDACRLTERVRELVRRARVHPEAELIRTGRGLTARLRHRAELAEPSAMAARVHIVQQVDVAVRKLCHTHPELLVAARPEVPGVSTGPLQVGQPTAIAVVVFSRIFRLRRWTFLHVPRCGTGRRSEGSRARQCDQPCPGQAHQRQRRRPDAPRAPWGILLKAPACVLPCTHKNGETRQIAHACSLRTD